MYEFQFSGILADDMGLGKTIQTLAHLSKLKEDKKLTTPSLVVMPTSLIANWKNEAKKFTPNLKVLSLHGNDRADRFELIEEYDIVLINLCTCCKRLKKYLINIDFSILSLMKHKKLKTQKRRCP
ncbi:MAG: SNF2-related protein [Sulfurimonas sp.]|nr:SNF2-related protein [Sulfurimonas sp.]